MSNDPNFTIDFSIPLGTFIASAVGDGTWSDIFQTLKRDQAGMAAPATTIEEAAGEIWANAMDDFFILVYGLNAGAEILESSTEDATPVQVKTLASLPADGGSVRIKVEVSASDGGARFLDGDLGGLFYRTGGVLSVLNGVYTIVNTGFATADAQLSISGDDIVLEVTGDLGVDVDWKIKVTRVEVIS